MTDWRERAHAIRATEDQCTTSQSVAVARNGAPDVLREKQELFARHFIHEVLVPVLREFGGIVTRETATPVVHEYDRRTFGITCDLDSARFVVHVFLLADGNVRIAVFLGPSQVEPHYRDFELSASKQEIEQWFGGCLVKLYEERVPIHGLSPKERVHSGNGTKRKA